MFLTIVACAKGEGGFAKYCMAWQGRSLEKAIVKSHASHDSGTIIA